MVLLLFPSGLVVFNNKFIYIPLWFYFYLGLALDLARVALHLHSTMVLLLLCNHLEMKVSICQFTFHYGSTSIPSTVPVCPQPIVFTFHYGSTSIPQPMRLRTYNTNLHSTMVLLLLELKNKEQIEIQEFTFHYGSTSIVILSRSLAFSTEFTFHYGSTSMCTWQECYNNPVLIYIPLWFYFYYS